MNGLRGFFGTARWVATQSLVAVVLVGFAALFEGVALLALAPVFQQQLPGGAVGLTVRIADMLAVPRASIIIFALLLFALLAFASAAARLGGDALLMWIRTRVEETARRKMTEALMHVRWEAFPELKLGEIGKSIYQEGWYIGVGTQVTLQAAGLLAASLFYLAIALIIAPAHTALALLVAAGAGVLVRGMRKRVRGHTAQFLRLSSEIGNRVQDIFGNLKFFRASGMLASAEESAESIYRSFARSYFRAYAFGPASRFLLEGAAIVFMTSILYVGVAVSRIDVASLVVFLAILLRAAPRLLTMQNLLFQASTYDGWHQEWKARLRFAEDNREAYTGGEAVEFRDSLHLVGVGFKYPAREQFALEGVNFNLGVREFVGIVGPSGSGKSTLLDLVTGVLRPTEGRAEIDSTDLRRLSLQAWRSRIGLVLQETPIFRGSVLDNVVWGSLQRDEAWAMACLSQAHAQAILDKLPGGLHGEVGERGAQLSGGERQRIALARALYRRPALLILDEATSALDSASEREILRAIAELRGRCAILMIAHRLSAVRDADRILVLDGGRIVEEGSWSNLMARPGSVLQRMAASQGLAPAADSVAVAK